MLSPNRLNLFAMKTIMIIPKRLNNNDMKVFVFVPLSDKMVKKAVTAVIIVKERDIEYGTDSI